MPVNPGYLETLALAALLSIAASAGVALSGVLFPGSGAQFYPTDEAMELYSQATSLGGGLLYELWLYQPLKPGTYMVELTLGGNMTVPQGSYFLVAYGDSTVECSVPCRLAVEVRESFILLRIYLYMPGGGELSGVEGIKATIEPVSGD